MTLFWTEVAGSEMVLMTVCDWRWLPVSCTTTSPVGQDGQHECPSCPQINPRLYCRPLFSLLILYTFRVNKKGSTTKRLIKLNCIIYFTINVQNILFKKHSQKTHSIAKPFHRRLQDKKNKNKLNRSQSAYIRAFCIFIN